MTRIGRLFEDLKRDGRKGLIAYLTAGDPSPDRTPALVEALVRGGADLIELGVPFSDPIADGPVIQRAGERALKAGTTLRTVLRDRRRDSRAFRSSAAAVHLSQPGAALRPGAPGARRRAPPASMAACSPTPRWKRRGIMSRAMHRHGLDTVFLAAPTSTEAPPEAGGAILHRLRLSGLAHRRHRRARFALGRRRRRWSRAVRAVTDLPLAVGFGISKPEHVAELGRQVEAVVVGSAFVRADRAQRAATRRSKSSSNPSCAN